MAEPIKIPFGVWTQVGPRNHVLDGVQIPMVRGNFEAEGDPVYKEYHECSAAMRPFVKFL